MPATPVLSVSPGRTVEVAGSAVPMAPDAVVRSPFTDTPCLVCRWSVQEYDPDAPDLFEGSDWREVDAGERSVPFYVEDATGRVLLDPDGASLELSVHDRRLRRGEELSADDPARRHLEAALAAGADWAAPALGHGSGGRLARVAAALDLHGPREWVLTEHRLEPGEPVHAVAPASERRTDRHEVGVVHALLGDPGDRAVITEGTEADAEWSALYGGLLGLAVATALLGVGALSLLAWAGV